MTHGIHPTQVALMVASLIMPILGLAFLWVTRKTRQGLFLGLAVGLFGLFWLTFGTGMAMVETGNAGGAWLPFLVAQVIYVAMAAAIAAFGIVHPDIVLDRPHKLGLVATGLLAVGLSVYLVANRTWVLTLDGPSSSYWTLLDPAFWTALLVVVGLLGRRWLGSPPGAQRAQLTWGLIPFIFLALLEGLVWHIYPIFLGPRHGWAGFLGDVGAWPGRVVILTAMATGLALAGVATRRVLQGRATSEDRALAFVTLYLLPLTLLPVLYPVYRQGGIPDIHPLLVTLFVFLVLYGVARYSIVDLDLKVKWGLEKSTIVGAFGVVFLLVSEAVETLLDVEGALFGLGAAVIIGLFFRRIEQGAQRLADRMMPGVKATPGYLAERRRTIYRAQVEALARDGELRDHERRALDRLRTELDLDTDHAKTIEAEILQAPPGTTTA